MADEMELKPCADRKYLLVKRGLYYRPDNQGYTGVKVCAGRYLESDASPEVGVTAIHQDEAPMFSPACWNDIKVQHLLDRITELEDALRRIDALRPVTCEMTLAHEMADIASDALRTSVLSKGEELASLDSGPYEQPLYGILNAYGDFWTPLVFSSEKQAWDYLLAFWRQDPKQRAECLRVFKVVPVRVRLDQIPNPTPHDGGQ
jgi:hypothetical protein